jgi:hypothetical protein
MLFIFPVDECLSRAADHFLLVVAADPPQGFTGKNDLSIDIV